MARADDAGWSLVEVLVTVALVATVTSLSAPPVMHLRDELDGRHAAHFLAGRLRAARQQAILTGRHSALVFDRVDDGWGFAACHDTDGDGVLRSDIASGADQCEGPARGLAAWFPRTDITVVTLGASRIASMSPLGTSSSGSVTLATHGGRTFMVRVSGVTGRVRVSRYRSETGVWQEL